MDRLKVTPQELKNEAENFKTKAQETKALTDGMMDIIDEISGTVWSGEAQNAYVTQFKKLDDECKKVYKMINKFYENLTTIAKNYDDAEDKNKGKAGALKIEPIILK